MLVSSAACGRESERAKRPGGTKKGRAQHTPHRPSNGVISDGCATRPEHSASGMSVPMMFRPATS